MYREASIGKDVVFLAEQQVTLVGLEKYFDIPEVPIDAIISLVIKMSYWNSEIVGKIFA